MRVMIAVLIVGFAISVAVLTNPTPEDYAREVWGIMMRLEDADLDKTRRGIIYAEVQRNLVVDDYILFSSAKLKSTYGSVDVGYGLFGSLHVRREFEEYVVNRAVAEAWDKLSLVALHHNRSRAVLLQFDSLANTNHKLALRFQREMAAILNNPYDTLRIVRVSAKYRKHPKLMPAEEERITVSQIME